MKIIYPSGAEIDEKWTVRTLKEFLLYKDEIKKCPKRGILKFTQLSGRYVKEAWNEV